MSNMFLKLMGKLSLLLIIVSFATGCDDDKDDLTPGLSVEQTEIGTFPGDTVLINGTASNYAGLSTITLSCEGWEINKVFDLSKHKPTVFNYEYQLIVPKTASFDQALTVTVCDVNGLKNEKYVALKFIPDTESPVLRSSLPERIAVDFNAEEGKGIWNLNITFTDDRELKDIRVWIPGIGVNETVQQTGRTGQLNRTIDFTTSGEFPTTITITDTGGNEAVIQTTIVVMLSEDEDPYQDYAQMYIVNAAEHAGNYVNGYYRYMDRTGEYQYTARFYAPADNTPIYFVPTKAMDADLFGVSPYVNSKLLNKNGYVEPVLLPKKGYYTVWIDLDTHIYNVTEYTVPTDTYTGLLVASGTGFTVGDWGNSTEMTLADSQNPYRKQVEMELAANYAGEKMYYFANNVNWTPVFRGDKEGNWWFEAASGSCVTFTTDYAGKVMVTFDTAALWGTIKKVTD